MSFARKSPEKGDFRDLKAFANVRFPVPEREAGEALAKRPKRMTLGTNPRRAHTERAMKTPWERGGAYGKEWL